MSEYLIGVYECKVDSKVRVMMPMQLKKQLGASLTSSFILKRSVFHPCLELFTIESWNNVVKDINKLNRFVKKNNDFIIFPNPTTQSSSININNESGESYNLSLLDVNGKLVDSYSKILEKNFIKAIL